MGLMDVLSARYIPVQQGCIMNNSFDMLSQMVGNTPLIKLRANCPRLPAVLFMAKLNL